MADVRVQFDAAPNAPERYDVDNERRFRAIVDRMSVDITRALQDLKADIEAAAAAGSLPHKATHEAGGADALTTLSASILLTGTLPDARLSSNIPRLDTSQNWTAQQVFRTSGTEPLIVESTSNSCIATMGMDINDTQTGGTLQLRFENHGKFRYIFLMTDDDDDGDGDGGNLDIYARKDDGTVAGRPIRLGRAGSGQLGFFDTAPQAKQTGVAVTAAGIHAALVTYGLIS